MKECVTVTQFRKAELGFESHNFLADPLASFFFQFMLHDMKQGDQPKTPLWVMNLLRELCWHVWEKPGSLAWHSKPTCPLQSDPNPTIPLSLLPLPNHKYNMTQELTSPRPADPCPCAPSYAVPVPSLMGEPEASLPCGSRQLPSMKLLTHLCHSNSASPVPPRTMVTVSPSLGALVLLSAPPHPTPCSTWPSALPEAGTQSLFEQKEGLISSCQRGITAQHS